MTTKEVADQLVALCRAGRNIEAVETLLSADVVSVEARGDESMPAVMSGLDVIRGKNQWWIDNHTVHSAEIKGPFPNGDRFAVIYDFVVTPMTGPLAGRKMRMEEVALYEVRDGKIVREEFFYDMSGASSDPVTPSRKKAKKAAKKKAAKKKAAKKKVKKAARLAPKAKAKAKAKARKPKAKKRAKKAGRRR
jgi:hypothetical protein